MNEERMEMKMESGLSTDVGKQFVEGRNEDPQQHSPFTWQNLIKVNEYLLYSFKLRLLT